MSSEPPKPNRRDFLKGRAAVDAVQNRFDQEEPPLQEPASLAAARSDVVAANYLMQVSRRAMATDFQVYLNASQYPGGAEAAVAALDLVLDLESQMTVYRDQSEVVEINRRAAKAPVRVETRLFQVLRLAQELYETTGGAFDITSGALSRVWGFFRRQGQFPQAEDIDAALQRLGGKHVELDTENETIRFLQPDLEINLNAIGKGYALDRCAESIEAGQVHDFLIHGGQSSVLARGDRKRMQAEAPRGWQVALRHPLRDGVRMGDIWLRDRALGTSGAAKQYFYHQGRRYGHVIDPRTGWPAEGVFSASVIAPTAALADALSTAFYVMGPVATAEYCRQQPHVAAILVCPARRSGSLAIHEFNVEPSLWTMRDEFAAARVSPPSTSIE
jgi:thiamine biosynthesis lipoprotein